MDLFNLTASLTLDTSEFERGIKSAKTTMAGVGKAFGTVIKGIGIATGAAAAGVGALTKSAVDNYGEYEQLWGGVQKLFGNAGMSLEDYAAANNATVAAVKADWQALNSVQDTVLKNARNAYKTTGMSANQYMTNATAFAASLINSLGGDTKAAAEQTDVAMKAISDNFNTFGSNIEDVTNAFKGFSKQNYTMLDNLKLGYGGTKTEMERLIDDANEYAASIGEASDLTIDSFSDIVTAIELIQKKQGIAGTTAREATTTIQGSVGMAKAAWENLLTGLGDSTADLKSLMEELEESVSTAFKNILPVAERAMEGIAQLVSGLAPQIAAVFPELVANVLPGILDAAIGIVTALADGLVAVAPALVDTVVGMADMMVSEAVPAFLTAGGAIIMELARGVTQALPTLLDSAADVVIEICMGIQNNFSEVMQVALDFVNALAEGLSSAIPQLLPVIVNMVTAIGTMIINNLPQILQAGINIVLSLVDGIIQSIPTLIDALPALIAAIGQALLDSAPELIAGAIQLVGLVVANLPQIMLALFEAIPQIIAELISSFTPFGDGMISALSETWGTIAAETSAAWDSIQAKTAPALETLKTSISGAWETVKSKTGTTWQNVKSTVSATWSNMTTTASTKFSAMKETISTAWESAKSKTASVWDAIKASVTNGSNGAGSIVTDKFTAIRDTMGNLMQSAKDKVSAAIDRIKGLFNFSWSLPRLKLPHFSWSWRDVGGILKLPSISVSWYKKAYDQPYIFTRPTVLQGFGDGNGGEMVYGKNSLMADIREAVSGVAQPANISINVYAAQGQDERKIAEEVERALSRSMARQRLGALA